MKKLLVLLLSGALCFNNAFLTVQALEDDPAPSEEPSEDISEDNEKTVPYEKNTEVFEFEESVALDEPMGTGEQYEQTIESVSEEQSTDNEEETVSEDTADEALVNDTSEEDGGEVEGGGSQQGGNEQVYAGGQQSVTGDNPEEQIDEILTDVLNGTDDTDGYRDESNYKFHHDAINNKERGLYSLENFYN